MTEDECSERIELICVHVRSKWKLQMPERETEWSEDLRWCLEEFNKGQRALRENSISRKKFVEKFSKNQWEDIVCRDAEPTDDQMGK